MSAAAGGAAVGPTAASRSGASRLFATSSRDGRLVVCAAVYAAALATALALGNRAESTTSGAMPRLGAIIALALGLAWMSNTISHVHLHTPLFRARGANRGFSLFLTLVLGIPQTLWKRRHLQHHALAEGLPEAARLDEVVEVAVLLGLWVVAALVVPPAFFGTFVPAWLAGLGLCAVQGHYEHVGGSAGGVDHHRRLYNILWFNDGYHSQHHRAPTTHWTALGATGPLAVSASGARVSRWPPLLRWLEDVPAIVPTILDRLERVALTSRLLRAFLLWTHGPAMAALVRAIGVPQPRRICVIGGGLFPRTAILLSRILPDAELVVVDADAAHLRAAERVLRDESARGEDRASAPSRRVTFVLAHCDGGAALAAEAAGAAPFDLIVVPLALRGARDRFYAARPGCHVLVHDWIWRRRGDHSRVISPLLLKRLNLVRDPHSVPRFSPNLDSLSRVASANAARCAPSCRMTAPTTPTGGPEAAASRSTTRSSPVFEAAIARHS